MKNDYFLLPLAEQRLILEQTAIRKSLPKQAVEKDLWVTSMLQIMFGLPCAESLVFKGGTSLSKVWNLISRFSEDIDLAIDRTLFGLDGNLTKKGVKKLRKASSVFVKETLCQQLQATIGQTPLKNLCQIYAQPDGEGESTYPEPRIIFVAYQSIFEDKLDYIAPIIKIEAGARSLLEPAENEQICSMVENALPNINTTIANNLVRTAVAKKTFLEKAFLLHELFSVANTIEAHRRSRHIYDLHIMMKRGIMDEAIKDDTLWETIRHHRSTLTSMNGVDYTPDIRDRIQLVPPKECRDNWQYDYELMTGAMIYGPKPTFTELMASMEELERRFRNHE